MEAVYDRVRQYDSLIAQVEELQKRGDNDKMPDVSKIAWRWILIDDGSENSKTSRTTLLDENYSEVFAPPLFSQSCAKTSSVFRYPSIDMLVNKRSNSVGNISRIPFPCPVSKCKHEIGVTSMLTHFILDHCEETGMEMQEIFVGERVRLAFNPEMVELNESQCLSVLAFAGTKGDKLPAEVGLCINNAFLPVNQEKLANHLPILVMASKTSWIENYSGTEIEDMGLTDENAFHVLVNLWLATQETTIPIYGTIMVYGVDKKVCTSVTCQLAPFKICREHNIPNMIQLSVPDILTLTDCGEHPLLIDVHIYKP